MANEERGREEQQLGLLPEDLARERGTLPWPKPQRAPPAGYTGGGGFPTQAPGVNAPSAPSSDSVPFTPPPVNPQLLAATRRQGSFLTIPMNFGLEDVQIRDQEKRLYFLIQNTSAVGDMLLGFGSPPITGGTLVLVPGAAFEPFTVPTNDIYVRGTAAGMTGILIIAVEGDIEKGNI